MAKKESVPRFSASELIRAASGVNRDILTVALSPGQTYTEVEAKQSIDEFLSKGGADHARR